MRGIGMTVNCCVRAHGQALATTAWQQALMHCCCCICGAAGILRVKLKPNACHPNAAATSCRAAHTRPWRIQTSDNDHERIAGFRYCQSSKVLCTDRNALGLQSSPIGRPIGLLGSDRIAQNSKSTPVWAANTRHKASDLCSAATLGMRMPCLVSEWSRTSGLLRVAYN